MRFSGSVLWANLHLLFWLSLIPFVTGWMGENHFSGVPVALYGADLLLTGVAYYVLARCLISIQGADSALARAVGRDYKSISSMVVYALAIPLSFVSTWIAFTLYIGVAVMWFLPDRRVEHVLANG